MEWMDKAACIGHDPELWFPEKTTTLGKIRFAKMLCFDECPVQAQCLNHSQEHRIVYGIWGGYTAKERWQMRRQTGDSYRPKWASSPLYIDRIAARRAFERAQRIGVRQTARDFGVDPKTLYRVWNRHGLGVPIHDPARRRMFCRKSESS